MLDIKFIRNNPEIVREAIKNKNDKADLDAFLKLDSERRDILSEVEKLKNIRNTVSKEVGDLKKQGKNADEKIAEMKEVGDKISALDERIRKIDEDIEKILIWIPNIPHSSVPVGDATHNKIIKVWGEQRKFDFKPLDHYALAESRGIIDFPRASKITGHGFALFKGAGARLERALINFMLDLHINKHGYTEIFPPFLVNRKTMFGTGQLPKLEEDMYYLKDDDYFLIPTAEVPVTNIFRDEILDGKDLPIYYVAYTPCFRREAGSYGKDTKGLIRVHQFDKVEMVKFTTKETSYDEHEKLLQNAEEVLQLLGLPYRVVLLATGDLSFAGAKCYDLEAWAPGTEKWLEVSSCSNFEDFQARRANIRYRPAPKEKPEFVHTLNASGVAMPRTVIAIMENYQTKDGRIIVPEVLKEYMGGIEVI